MDNSHQQVIAARRPILIRQEFGNNYSQYDIHRVLDIWSTVLWDGKVDHIAEMTLYPKNLVLKSD